MTMARRLATQLVDCSAGWRFRSVRSVAALPSGNAYRKSVGPVPPGASFRREAILFGFAPFFRFTVC
jgi:hypothetical protein